MVQCGTSRMRPGFQKSKAKQHCYCTYSQLSGAKGGNIEGICATLGSLDDGFFINPCRV
jgi:hypothetical protein